MTRRAEMGQESTPAVSGGSSGQSAQQPGVREVPVAAFMVENPGFITISKSGG